VHAFQKKAKRGIAMPKTETGLIQALEAPRTGLPAMERDREPHMTGKVTPSSGNVFADFGLPEAAAELVKAELTYQLAKRINTLGAQAATARRLGERQVLGLADFCA
jgi:hypothetical protein